MKYFVWVVNVSVATIHTIFANCRSFWVLRHKFMLVFDDNYTKQNKMFTYKMFTYKISLNCLLLVVFDLISDWFITDFYCSVCFDHFNSCFSITSFLLNLSLGAFPVAYDAVSDVLASCQLAAFLEVVHPLIGIVKTGVMAPFMQVCIVTIKS